MRQFGLGPRLTLALLLAALVLCGSPFIGVVTARPAPSERFADRVRGDMFAGMAGDAAAMNRAMKLCEDTLAKDPENAEALVWHGSGLLFLGGRAKRDDDAKGTQWMARAVREMDDAVAKAPDRISVLLPRGATLLEYSRHDPSPERARGNLQKALGDYEKVLGSQKSDWQTLSVHARGELLSGLAEGWLRAGDSDKARSYMERLQHDTEGSPYAARARDFLTAAAARKQLDWHCLGCHVASAAH